MQTDWGTRIDWSLLQSWALKISSALLILIITHFIAKGVQWALSRAVDRIAVLKRHWHTSSGDSIGRQLGKLAYWLVWLVGLVTALAPLGLDQVVAPINNLTGTIFSFIPNLIGAGLIFFIGLVIATIVRRILEVSLSAANADDWLARIGIGEAGSTSSITRAAGLTVFVLIIIPVATAALQALRLTSLSDPLVEILHDIALFLPRMIATALVLSLAYLIAKLVRRWIEQLMGGLSLADLGLPLSAFEVGQVAGLVAVAAIMLMAATASVGILGIPSLARMLAELTELGGHVLFGAAIIIAGVLLAGFLASVARASGDQEFAPAIIRYAVIALATAMGLRFMGLANEVVNLAFGLILGSAAVACALAFGLGGRETAHKLLQRWTSPADETVE